MSPTNRVTSQVVDADGVGVRPHHDPYVVAVGDQLAGDVGTEKPVGADDQLGLFHLPQPYCRIQLAASSGSVPSSWALRHHFIVADTKRSGL